MLRKHLSMLYILALLMISAMAITRPVPRKGMTPPAWPPKKNLALRKIWAMKVGKVSITGKSATAYAQNSNSQSPDKLKTYRGIFALS
jgi:hypothetical protein